MLSDFIKEKYKLVLDNKNLNFINKSVHIIKYENFINNHQKILNDLMDKLSLNFLFSKDHNYWDHALNLNLSDKNLYKSDLWEQPISNKKIGNYKKILSDKEISEINLYCKDLIEKFDY